MPKREKFFGDLQQENGQAALLVAQSGGAPGELQLIVQTALYDERVEGLRPLGGYIIRVLGALEHRIANLGMTTDHVQLVEEHPLLYQYNHPPAAVFFRGAADDINALVLDITQAHASTFGPWRVFPEYINVEQPLFSLFESGGGLLGQMPRPLAERVVKVLERHGLEVKVTEGTAYHELHDNPALRQQKPQVLLLGASYFVSYAFSFEEVGKV